MHARYDIVIVIGIVKNSAVPELCHVARKRAYPYLE
jgi:hypothetical protein